MDSPGATGGASDLHGNVLLGEAHEGAGPRGSPRALDAQQRCHLLLPSIL